MKWWLEPINNCTLEYKQFDFHLEQGSARHLRPARRPALTVDTLLPAGTIERRLAILLLVQHVVLTN